jgi:hypothetical protein
VTAADAPAGTARSAAAAAIPPRSILIRRVETILARGTVATVRDRT